MLISKSPPDRGQIAMDHPEEIKHWSKHFGVTPDELRLAVEKVGNSAAAVRKELGLAESNPPVD